MADFINEKFFLAPNKTFNRAIKFPELAGVPIYFEYEVGFICIICFRRAKYPDQPGRSKLFQNKND